MHHVHSASLLHAGNSMVVDNLLVNVYNTYIVYIIALSIKHVQHLLS